MTEKKLIAFTMYPGVTPLDLVGPLTVLRDLGRRSRYATVVVGEHTDAMVTDTPLQMIANRSFDDVPHPFAVIVPGAGPGTIQATRDERLLDYVRSAAESAEFVGSTGAGALILAAAGLLSGRQAAIHWAYRDELERLGAGFSRERWTEDGKLLTAAGGSAGIDMMLYLLAKLKSRASASLTQVVIEYDPHPPFGDLGASRGDEEARVLESIRGPEVGLAARKV